MFQGAREKQKIKSEEVQIQVVERKKAIEVEEKEIQRKEKELTATVKSPAEAESYKMETIAQGKRYGSFHFKSTQNRTLFNHKSQNFLQIWLT